MKKYFGILMLAMLAVCSVAFVSCGDDDEIDPNNPLVGTWMWTDKEDVEEVEFRANNTFSWYEYDYGDPRDLDYEGTYSVEGDIVTMVSSELGGKEVYRFEISNKVLTLYEKNRNGNWELYGKYTRK